MEKYYKYLEKTIIHHQIFKAHNPKPKMTFAAKIQKFITKMHSKMTACYKEMVPDAYEGQEVHTRDPYGTCEHKRPAGYIIGGQYGA